MPRAGRRAPSGRHRGAADMAGTLAGAAAYHQGRFLQGAGGHLAQEKAEAQEQCKSRFLQEMDGNVPEYSAKQMRGRRASHLFNSQVLRFCYAMP